MKPFPAGIIHIAVLDLIKLLAQWIKDAVAKVETNQIMNKHPKWDISIAVDFVYSKTNTIAGLGNGEVTVERKEE